MNEAVIGENAARRIKSMVYALCLTLSVPPDYCSYIIVILVTQLTP